MPHNVDNRKDTSPAVPPKRLMPDDKILAKLMVGSGHKMLLCQKMAHNIT